MTRRLQWWTPRAARRRALTISNRALLCFESLETRTLLSSGIFQNLALDNPTANLALVLEPTHGENGASHSNHGLTDTVGLDGSTKLLNHPNQRVFGPESLADLDNDRLVQSFSTARGFAPADGGVSLTTSQLLNELNTLFNRELAAFLSPSLALYDPFFGLGSSFTITFGSTDVTPTSATSTTNGSQPVQTLNLQTLLDLSQLGGNVSSDIRVGASDPSTPGTGQTPAATSNATNAGSGSGTVVVRTTTTGSGTHAGTDTRVGTAVNNASTTPSIAPDLVRTPGTPVTTTTQPPVFTNPAAVAAASTGTVTAVPPPATPVAPAQEVLAGTLDTTTPYARFELTIQTKEGYKTANGEEQPARPVRPSPVIKPVDQEQEQADLLLDQNADSAADQAALHRRRLDALYADPNALASDENAARSHAGLAVAAIFLGSFWGAQSRKEENRKRRQQALRSLWKRIWR